MIRMYVRTRRLCGDANCPGALHPAHRQASYASRQLRVSLDSVLDQHSHHTVRMPQCLLKDTTPIFRSDVMISPCTEQEIDNIDHISASSKQERYVLGAVGNSNLHTA